MIPRFLNRALSGAPGALGAYYSAYKDFRCGDPYVRLIASLADRSRWAVDVGAHLRALLGEYTFFMRRHAARCVAFECNPDLVAHLRRRFGDSVDLAPVQTVRLDDALAPLAAPPAVTQGLWNDVFTPAPG